MQNENLGGWVEAMAGALVVQSPVASRQSPEESGAETPDSAPDTVGAGSRPEDGIGSYKPIELAIACKCGPQQSFRKEIDGVTYYSLGYSSKTRQAELTERCESILADFAPDLVQIEGTEFPHAGAMLKAAKKAGIPTVVSLQGILQGYYPYQCGNLQIDEMMFSRSIKKISAAWILHLRKTRWYKKRMPAEAEVLRLADHFIGRTFWDRAHSYAINPDAKYHSVNRILRTPFYKKDWNINGIERHSIYVGNGYSALKGAHFVIEALPQLIREYPDVKVYIAGTPAYRENDRRPFYKKGYGLYLEKLVDDLGVADHVVFTGSLKADEVADRLSRTHVYVLCSAIENSPNTLGEAMMIGTPSVAAYVGGVPDMAADGVEALFYRNDDPALLVWNIKRIFDDDSLAISLSEASRKRASVTHDPARNAAALRAVYEEILK